MANTEQELEVLIDLLGSKKEAGGMVAAAEELVKYAAQIADDNQKAQGELKEYATKEVVEAMKRIRDGRDGTDGRTPITVSYSTPQNPKIGDIWLQP